MFAVSNSILQLYQRFYPPTGFGYTSHKTIISMLEVLVQQYAMGSHRLDGLEQLEVVDYPRSKPAWGACMTRALVVNRTQIYALSQLSGRSVMLSA